MTYLTANITLVVAQAQPVTTDSINTIFQSNIDAITTNFGAAQGAGSELLLGLATIELLLFLYSCFLARPESIIKEGTQKLFLIFVTMLLTLNWGAFANGVMGYVSGAASTSGGATGSITSLDPAVVASQGIDRVAIIFNAEARAELSEGMFGTSQDDRIRARKRAEARARNEQARASWTEDTFGASPASVMEEMMTGMEATAMELIAMFIYAFLALLIIFVHFYVALQIFVITLEFYITVSITQLFVPFLMNKHTSPVATSAVNAVIGKAVKLGVLMLILAMFGKGLEGAQLGPAPTLVDLLGLLLATCTLAFMVSRSDSIASGIFSGAGAGINVGGALMAASIASGSAAAQGSAKLTKFAAREGSSRARAKIDRIIKASPRNQPPASENSAALLAGKRDGGDS